MASVRIKEFIANLKLIAQIQKRGTVKSDLSDVLGYMLGNPDENFDKANKKVEDIQKSISGHETYLHKIESKITGLEQTCDTIELMLGMEDNLQEFPPPP